MADVRTRVTRVVRQHRGVPVVGYRTDPATPPVSVLRLDRITQPDLHPHIHDFPILALLRPEHAVYVIAPGQLIDTATVTSLDDSVTVFFDPNALGGDARAPWPTWHRHPLLSPFLHGHAGGLLRVELPPGNTVWEDTMTAIEAELAAERDGYRQAAIAHLTLLLIDLARLTADVAAGLRDNGEPLLASVFDVIERGYTEPMSLRDVARAVGITPGHLTTVVRRRTGRAVQDWIIERRMAAARELLAGTDLPIAEIAHRVGLPDPGYFSRVFRRTQQLAPRAWRDRTHTSP